MTALNAVTGVMRYTAVPTDEVGFRIDRAGEWIRYEDYVRLRIGFERGTDAFHVLRILGNGQISAGKAAELLRYIQLGEKPELMPFEAFTSKTVMVGSLNYEVPFTVATEIEWLRDENAKLRRELDAPETKAEPEWQWTRDDETTRDCLLLVCLDIPVSEIATWTDEQVQHVEQWAGACHAVASDNEVEIPPKPICIIEWQSSEKSNCVESVPSVAGSLDTEPSPPNSEGSGLAAGGAVRHTINKPAQLIAGAPRCDKHGVNLAFEGDICWACREEDDAQINS